MTTLIIIQYLLKIQLNMAENVMMKMVGKIMIVMVIVIAAQFQIMISVMRAVVCGFQMMNIQRGYV